MKALPPIEKEIERIIGGVFASSAEAWQFSLQIHEDLHPRVYRKALKAESAEIHVYLVVADGKKARTA